MDDPHMNGILTIPGITGCPHIKNPCEFQLDYSQFITLTRSSYNAATAFDRKLIQDLSFSMYQYYCVVLLWKRVLYIISTHGVMCKEQMQLDDHLSYGLPVPSDIRFYLDGIGDIHDPAFADFQLTLQANLTGYRFNGAGGSYGKVDAGTHLAYETVPSLLVALLKIRADIMFTQEEPGFHPDWELPPGLKPDHPRAKQPNHNLLCWSKAEMLTELHLETLAHVGVDKERFSVVNVGDLPVNRTLILYVASALESSRNQALGTVTTSPYGSVSQLPYTTRVPADGEVTVYRPISAKLGRTSCYTLVSPHIAGAAAIFRYRVQRRGKTGCDMVCYKFAHGVPEDWLENEDDVFDYGAGKLMWNNGRFSICEHHGENLASNIAYRVRREVPT